MSRGIPKVRKWHVTTEDGRSCTVETINKRFARWIGREILDYPEGHLRVSSVRADWRPLIPYVPAHTCAQGTICRATRHPNACIVQCVDGDHTFDVGSGPTVLPCVVCGARPTDADVNAILETETN